MKWPALPLQLIMEKEIPANDRSVMHTLPFISQKLTCSLSLLYSSLLTLQETETHIHLVMEYCSQGDLSQYIKRKGDGPPSLPSPPGGGLNEVVVRHFLKQLGAFVLICFFSSRIALVQQWMVDFLLAKAHISPYALSLCVCFSCSICPGVLTVQESHSSGS